MFSMKRVIFQVCFRNISDSLLWQEGWGENLKAGPAEVENKVGLYFVNIKGIDSEVFKRTKGCVQYWNDKKKTLC